MEQRQVARLFRVPAALQIGANSSLNEAGDCGGGRQHLGFVSVIENDLGADLNYLWV